MEDDVNTGTQTGEKIHVANISVDNRDVGPLHRFAQVFVAAAGEIIEHDDFARAFVALRDRQYASRRARLHR